MGNKRRSKADASTVNDAKRKAETGPRGGALRRAAKAKKKASAWQTKVQQTFQARSSELDAALMALKKADVGSPQARAVEKAVRVALKAVLGQRRKLRKARKALRRAAAKERRAHDRTPVTAAKAAPAQAPAAQRRKASKKRPAKKIAAQKRPAKKPSAKTPPVKTPPVKTRPVKKRPVKKRQAKARAESAAVKPSVPALDTLPTNQAVSGVEAGGLQGSSASPTDRSV